MVLIIAGQMRSGTTLLNKLCDSHPDLFVTKEFGNFAAVNKPFRRYRKQVIKRARSARSLSPRSFMTGRSSILANFLFVTLHLLYVRSVSGRQVEVQHIREALRRHNSSAKVVGDKSPRYIFLLPKLAEIDGLMRVVIYRDCRDVVSSTLKNVRTVWKKRPWSVNWDTAEKVARRWVESSKIIEDHRDKIFLIRYEELVTDSENEMNLLGKFLNVDPNGFPIDIIKATSIGKYKEGLTSEELKVIEKIAGPTMGAMGYL